MTMMITKDTKKYFFIFAGLSVVSIISFYIYSYETKNKTVQVFTDEKLRICPDEWIDNQMPMIVNNDSLPKQYFILDGKRMEMSEFDTLWVFNNCPLKAQMVF